MHACQAHTFSICRCFCFRSRDLYELFGSGCLLLVECVFARVSKTKVGIESWLFMQNLKLS